MKKHKIMITYDRYKKVIKSSLIILSMLEIILTIINLGLILTNDVTINFFLFFILGFELCLLMLFLLTSLGKKRRKRNLRKMDLIVKDYIYLILMKRKKVYYILFITSIILFILIVFQYNEFRPKIFTYFLLFLLYGFISSEFCLFIFLSSFLKKRESHIKKLKNI
ncbi:hypothetical protein M3M35_05155 [Fructilactobacillus myrtifloralis]|uniref:Uncharacterized protein n=1 Tax=Fructilactobacillus myrtifloralis TaxID=2940301 RepID=A0ABY5BNL7_9LACO|nr:hypothetical protein [Fructilactobacillus myrtifloralis]USS84697.1 hypothetical protein M3M35_05155 [Fructilactobacillus myrtifloralis]